MKVKDRSVGVKVGVGADRAGSRDLRIARASERACCYIKGLKGSGKRSSSVQLALVIGVFRGASWRGPSDALRSDNSLILETGLRFLTKRTLDATALEEGLVLQLKVKMLFEFVLRLSPQFLPVVKFGNQPILEPF
jgi:hypothetical protein